MRIEATWAALVVALVALSAARPAAADNDLGLAVSPVEPVAGVLTVGYDSAHPLTPRLEETLLEGMPATVTCEVGLWKRRTFWFDKLVLALRSERKVVYDLWAKEFRIKIEGIPAQSSTAPDLDSLRTALFSGRTIPVADPAMLDSTATYYVTVRLTIRPLSPEDLGDIEEWLAGESTGPEGPRGIPRYLLDLTVSLSGLGERTAIAKGKPFVPARLSPASLQEP